MGIDNLRNIERLNYILALVAAVAAFIFLDRPWALGITIGAALTCANFAVLRFLAEKSRGKSLNVQLFMIPKMFVLIGLIVFAGKFLDISVIALASGFSIFLLSIAVESMRYLASVPSDQETGDSD